MDERPEKGMIVVEREMLLIIWTLEKMEYGQMLALWIRVSFKGIGKACRDEIGRYMYRYSIGVQGRLVIGE